MRVWENINKRADRKSFSIVRSSLCSFRHSKRVQTEFTSCDNGNGKPLDVLKHRRLLCFHFHYDWENIFSMWNVINEAPIAPCTYLSSNLLQLCEEQEETFPIRYERVLVVFIFRHVEKASIESCYKGTFFEWLWIRRRRSLIERLISKEAPENNTNNFFSGEKLIIQTFLFLCVLILRPINKGSKVYFYWYVSKGEKVWEFHVLEFLYVDTVKRLGCLSRCCMGTSREKPKFISNDFPESNQFASNLWRIPFWTIFYREKFKEFMSSRNLLSSQEMSERF